MVIFLIFLKISDILFFKFIGLGNSLIYRHSKIYGYDIQPNQNIKRRGKIVTINESGMRSLKSWSKDYDKKILFIGDSVTFGGSLVNDQDIFTEKICNKILDINVVCGNYAVNGFGIEAINKRIKYRNFSDEDLIIVTVIGNDFERGFNQLGFQPYYTKKTSNFFPALTELVFLILDRIRIKIKYDFKNISEAKDVFEKYKFDETANLIKTLNQTKKEYYVFYSPEIGEIEGQIDYSTIKKILRKEIKNFYDLTDEVKKYKKKVFYDGVHLTEFGHELYANAIFNIINSKLNFQSK